MKGMKGYRSVGFGWGREKNNVSFEGKKTEGEERQKPHLLLIRVFVSF